MENDPEHDRIWWFECLGSGFRTESLGIKISAAESALASYFNKS